MATFPSLPLFTDAWVADTKHLSRLERGTYHDLLVLMWRSPNCRVPNETSWLAKRLDMTVQEVESEPLPLISEFCQTDGNWLCQKRLLKEWNWCRKKRKVNSEAAKTRWSKEKPNSEGNTEPHCPPPHSTPPTIPEDKSSAPTPSPIYTDSRHELWGEGIAILGQLGVAEKAARSNIGRWLRDTKDNVSGVLNAIQRARDTKPIDAIPWINMALRTVPVRSGQGSGAGGKLSFFDIERGNFLGGGNGQ